MDLLQWYLSTTAIITGSQIILHETLINRETVSFIAHLILSRLMKKTISRNKRLKIGYL